MAEQAIKTALKDRLIALTFSPTIPIAWPNRDFVAPTVDLDARWFEAVFVTAPVQRLTIRARHRRSGSMVVTVASRVNKGTAQGEGLADAIAAHFPADLRLVAGANRIRITEDPSVRDGFLDGGYWRTPVIIPWEIIA